MAKPIIAPIPEFQDIGPNYTLRVLALSPTDGSAVSGVKVGTIIIDATQVDANLAPLEVQAPLLAHDPGGVNV